MLFVVGASVAAIYAYNKFIETNATKKNLLSTENGDLYHWKDYDIFYTKSGSGSPLLLIHDTDPSSSSEEWNKMLHRLERKHTVYCIDLLGCGRSDKPSMEYTNYFYAQMITAFAKDIIGEKVTVVATNMSASFAIMANHMETSLFEKMILINPVSLQQLNITPDKLSKFKKAIIELPFIGTFIYNLLTNNYKIEEDFRTKYYARPQLVSNRMKDTYYEAAHTGGSGGRFLCSSLLGNYVNNTITHAVKNLTTPTLIIGCKQLHNYELSLDDYHMVNPSLEIVRINNGSLYPQLEIPEKVSSIIDDYLD
jgi:pimeloyl-ACP methyl ester carboxylesterase